MKTGCRTRRSPPSAARRPVAGLVNHYFDGKEALLEATMRRLMRNLGEDIARRLPAEPTPLGRLHAVIDGCFSRRHFLPNSMVAWLTFWLEVRRNPRFARLQRVLNRRFESNIMFALRQLVAGAAGRGYLPRPHRPHRRLLVGLCHRCQADPAGPRPPPLPRLSRQPPAARRHESGRHRRGPAKVEPKIKPVAAKRIARKRT